MASFGRELCLCPTSTRNCFAGTLDLDVSAAHFPTIAETLFTAFVNFCRAGTIAVLCVASTLLHAACAAQEPYDLPVMKLTAQLLKSRPSGSQSRQVC
jgi:hypothetical protein